MRADQIERVEAAILKGYDILAGDTVVIVDDGDEYPVTCIMYDWDDNEGMIVGNAGIVDDGIREIIFTKRDIEDGPGDLTPTMHFEIDGARWDFAQKDPIQGAIVPIGGLQNLYIVHVTKATELEKTDAEATWGWNTSS